MMIMIDYYYDTCIRLIFKCNGGVYAHASLNENEQQRKTKTRQEQKMRYMENNEKVLMFIVSDRKLPSDKILPAKQHDGHEMKFRK